MAAGRVLVVDDEKNITFVIQAVLEKAGYEVLAYNDSAAALEAIDSEDLDAVVTDLYMPGVDGMQILEHCRVSHAELPVVIITAYGTVEAAVSALKRGAFDFVTKPFDQVELLNVIRKASHTYQARQKEPISIVSTPTQAQQAAASISSIIGSSAPMQDVFKVITKIAASSSTVLVTGESGTGKELVAFEIHRNSQRINKPFIKINCAAIPATLIESELFGYERGAFTGAVSAKPGRFELAHEGTLFLDEVAEMPLEMQVKLLRVLQEQEFERVGGVNTIKVDVRIITATNRDLESEVKAGRFREDLFYRLNVVPIHLPPLRDRREDIDLLVRYFLKQFVERFEKSILTITPETVAALRAYSWPGNIRQLENVLERMVLMADSNQLGVADLPEEIAVSAGLLLPGGELADSAGFTFKEIVKRQTQNLERDLIEKALEETGGNITRAAERLGLSRKGLQLKLKELGLKRQID
ncbi:MAG: sigma-54 dependent transcriptional regulator [Oligoflexia bacterium]|nr:sigma-54 dependent transcriptional regulator [Oligoflexia bacterium]